jgi:hypothetical protein
MLYVLRLILYVYRLEIFAQGTQALRLYYGVAKSIFEIYYILIATQVILNSKECF